MKKFVLFFSLFISLISFGQIVNPVSWDFSQKEVANGEVELTFTASINNGWHLYSILMDDGGPIPTSFTFEASDKYKLIDSVVTTTEEHRYFDELFGMDVAYYSTKAIFTQRVKPLAQGEVNIRGVVDFMSCNDETCTPPMDEEFSFKVGNANTESKTESKSLFLFFLISFVAGLAAILTPCVFPMIPMTVSFFMHGSESKLKARINAAVYGLSIILIYTVIGTAASIIFGPGIANFLSTHWLPNIIFFIAFMIFAFSFFGMFEIVMPSSLVNKADKGADKGGVFGAFFMALTLVLVSFSCTGPIVGAILVESAGGEVLKPIVGMFGFSLAFALPFTFFALFPQLLSNLPKSGGWLNSVKVVLGFIELALGLKFLSIADQTYHWGILDREVYLAIWIVLFILLGMYLLGKIKFSHDSDIKYLSVPRLLLATASFSFVIYLIPGMFGAPLKAISGYLPPMSTHDFDLHKIIRDEVKLVSSSDNVSYRDAANSKSQICEEVKYSEFLHLPHGLEGYFDYEQGLRCAKEQGKPIFIDFTGHGCVNCREMEANVWSDPRVLERLQNEFVIIALYVDDKTKLPEEEWVVSEYDGKTKKTLGKKYADFQITNYGVNAQPYYVLLDHNEEMLVEPKARDLNPDNFVKFLDTALAEFKSRK